VLHISLSLADASTLASPDVAASDASTLASPDVAAEVARLMSDAVSVFESILKESHTGEKLPEPYTVHHPCPKHGEFLFAASQHLAAAVRLSPLLQAFCNAREFPDVMRRLLCVHWALDEPRVAAAHLIDRRGSDDFSQPDEALEVDPYEDPAWRDECFLHDLWDSDGMCAASQQAVRAAAAAHGAAAAILAHLGESGVHLLTAAWAAASGSSSAELVVESVLSGQLRILQTRWVTTAAGARESAEVAAAHVRHMLDALQSVMAQHDIRFSAQSMCDVAQRMRDAHAVGGACWYMPLLRAGLVQWAREAPHATGGAAAPSAAQLETLAAACTHRAFPQHGDFSTEADDCRREALCLLLICSLAPGNLADAAGSCSELADAQSWLSAPWHAQWLLDALVDLNHVQRSANEALYAPAWLVSPLEGRVHDAALHLAAALRVTPLARAFTRAPNFAACMKELLGASWLLRSARDPAGVASAATAYAALASFLQGLDGDARRRLAAGWADLFVDTHGAGAATVPDATARELASNLSRELTTVCDLLSHADADARAGAKRAATQLMSLLAALHALMPDDGAGPAAA
jgi:hypothetical protein